MVAPSCAQPTTTMANDIDEQLSGGIDDIGVDSDIMDAVSNRLTGGSSPKFADTPETSETDEAGEAEEAERLDRVAEETQSEYLEEQSRKDRESEEAADDERDTETDEEREEREAREAEEAEAAKKEQPEFSAELKSALESLPEESRESVAKAFTAELGKAKSATERLGQRIEQLSAEVETERKRQGPVQVAEVPAALMLETEEQIDEHEQKLENFLDWAEDNAAGFNLTDSEDYDPAKPTYTPEQIRARRREVERERSKLLPTARANVAKRAALDNNLRALYPAAFDPKSEEYTAIENVLKAVPQLRQFPDARIIGLRQFLGARALAKLIEQQKEPDPKGKKSAGKDNSQPQEKKAKKPVPRAPGNGSPAKGSVLQHQRNRPATSEAVNKVYQDPSDKKAFTEAVAGLID